MNGYLDEYFQRSVSDAIEEEPFDEEMLNKPMSELTVKDMLTINSHSNKPLTKKLDDFTTQVNDKMSKMDKRIELLEAENIKKDEDNATLKEIIRNMQTGAEQTGVWECKS